MLKIAPLSNAPDNVAYTPPFGVRNPPRFNELRPLFRCWSYVMHVRVGLVSILLCCASAMAYADGYVDPNQAVALTVSNWTGLYGGLNIGGVQVDDGPMTSAPANAGTAAFWAGCFAVGGCPRNRAADEDTGFIGGAQLGYNAQFQSFLIGIEGDIQGISADNSRSVTAAAPGFVPFTGTAETKLEWLSTLRGRLGVLVTPTVLAYATGGLAYAGVERTFRAQFAPASPAGHFGKSEDQEFGWTVGGGLEWAIAKQVTVGAEYLYVDFDAAEQFSAVGQPGVGGCTAVNCNFTVQASDFDMQIARLKLNFGF